MTCLEDLKSDVAAILALMQIPQACCDAGDVTDGDRYTDRVTDGEGDVPQPIIDAGYADDSEDWEGFVDYKCMIATVLVDQLVAKLNEIAPLVDATGAILGGVAALAGILAVIFGTGGLAVVFGIVAGVGATSLLYQALTDFDWVDGLADKVTANNAELVCSIMNADGDESSLVALNDKIDELFTIPEALILKNMNLGPTLKSLYAGRYDQQDVAEILFEAGYELGDFHCDCEQIGEYLNYTNFESGTYEGWSHVQDGLIDGWGVGGSWCYRTIFEYDGYLHASVVTLINNWTTEGPVEAGDKVRIHRVRFSYKFSGDFGQRVRLTLNHNGGQVLEDYFYTGTYIEVEEIFSPPLESTYGVTECVKIRAIGDLSYMFIDNITVDFDFVPA